MKIYSGLDGFSVAKPVVTIGMFDGLHTGHRELLNQTISTANTISGESVVLTFWPHPRLVLHKDDESLRFLTSLEEKTVMFSQLGIDHLVIIPFDKAFAHLTAKEFIEFILVEQIGIAHLIIGFNHRFGSDGHKNPIDYNQMGEQYHFGVSLLPPVLVENERSSSTVIRNLLQKGEVKLANKILGYSYKVTGRVIGGQQFGRTINYPTANVDIEETAKLIPLDGVYACKVTVLGKHYKGMLNIGYRPTVSMQKDHRTLEVHILDFSQDIYSEEIVVEFIDRIRDEKKFESVELLIHQLKIDEFQVRRCLELI